MWHHVRAGIARHWQDITKHFIDGKMGRTLQEGGPFEIHRSGYLKMGKMGPNTWCGHRIFFPRTEVKIMPSAKESINMSAEMRECKESWLATWTNDGMDSMVHFNEYFMMGSSDTTVLYHIWGLEQVQPGRPGDDADSGTHQHLHEGSGRE